MAQAPKSSVFSRKIVNLFAGMAFGSPDLPRILKDGGYSCHSIETSFAVAPGQIVNPEIMLCSDVEQHTLIIEAKSGANLSQGQLNRYSSITSQSLEKAAFTSSASAKSHNLLIVGHAGWKDRLMIGSSKLPCARRVLTVADVKLPKSQEIAGSDEESLDAGAIGGILRIEGSFVTNRFNSAFNPLLDVNWDLVPNNFLPVDHESEDWEFAEYVIPEIIAAILNGENTLSLRRMAESFIRHWSVISSKYQMLLLARIRTILRLAAQKTFSPFLSYGRKGSLDNEIRLKPDATSQNTSRLRSQLKKRFKEFMDELNSPQIAIIYED